jgi:hypothetical protein
MTLSDASPILRVSEILNRIAENSPDIKRVRFVFLSLRIARGEDRGEGL